jgi:hypothetical protein
LSLPQSRFDWFTRPEIRRVLAGLAQADEHGVILIGGQSISFWALYYQIPVPETETPALTQDLDFMGTKKQAKALAKNIGASLKTAGFDDATPNTALLIWEPPAQSKTSARRLMIDFLNGVLGVSDADVIKLAVLVQIEDMAPIKVMHPLACMQSRFANLTLLSGKRDRNGLAQAQLSIRIVDQFIRKDVAGLGGTAIARAVSRVFEIAYSPHGVYAYHEFGLDALQAISLDLLPVDHPFLAHELPKLQRKLDTKREIENARRRGVVHLPKHTR